MIARTWRGRSKAEKADDYYRHFKSEVIPNLNSIAGHKGTYLFRRETDGEVEFLALTVWDSIETVKDFSGNNPELAHVQPEGRAALLEFDEFALNYEIVCNTVGGVGPSS